MPKIAAAAAALAFTVVTMIAVASPAAADVNITSTKPVTINGYSLSTPDDATVYGWFIVRNTKDRAVTATITITSNGATVLTQQVRVDGLSDRMVTVTAATALAPISGDVQVTVRRR